jgi:hypothetical protein
MISHALEETVRNIQEENARLRTQLESLLAIATTSSGTASSSSAPQTDNPMIDPSLGGTSSTDVAVHPDVETPYASMPLTGALSELGLDIPLLSSLHRQIVSLRAQVAEKEHANGSTGEEASSASKQVRTERNSLIALIAHLKEEREKIDRESALLEREIKQKKVLIGMEGAEESKEVKEDDAVAVERALIEVRSWLDDALKGWQDVSLALLQVMLIRSVRS